MELACAENVNTQNIVVGLTAQVTAFQSGAVFTLLIWCTIRLFHIKRKIYFFSAVTLIFSIARLLVTQPNAITADLNLTAAQIYLLTPFLNLGTMMNGLFTVHLATATEKVQEQRKYLFYLAFAATLTNAILSLFIERQLIARISFSIVLSLLTIILRTFLDMSGN